MESAYVDELKASINLLMANLESLPVTKGSNAESKYSLQKFKKYSKYVFVSYSVEPLLKQAQLPVCRRLKEKMMMC